jgi:hypothetical protein
MSSFKEIHKLLLVKGIKLFGMRPAALIAITNLFWIFV